MSYSAVPLPAATLMIDDTTGALKTTTLSGAATLGDGDDAALGATTVAAAPAGSDEDTTSRTAIGLLKGIKNILRAVSGYLAATLTVAVSGVSQSVTRTFATSADLSSPLDLAAPGTGKKAVITDLVISVSGAALVLVQMESTANVLAAFYMAANSTVVVSLRARLKGDANNKKVQLYSTSQVAARATCVWYEE